MIKTLLISFWLAFHPVHVTLTSVHYVPDTDSLKVFVRMYYDDFLIDYSLSGLTPDKESNALKDAFPDDLMNIYLNKKVNIIVNNKLLTGKLLDFKIEENEIRTNLLYTVDKRPRNITVRNLIMADLYSDQANMTIIKINDFEEGVMFTPLNYEQTFCVK